jgi:glycosyltransferase involved in cell wall biosynthesis
MKRVVIVGNSVNGIFEQMVGHFISEGNLVCLIDAELDTKHRNLTIVPSARYVRKLERYAIRLLAEIVGVVDFATVTVSLLVSLRVAEWRKFLRLPSLVRPITNMLLLSRVVNQLTVDYVVCLNVYFYGLCSILIKARNVVAQPWGSDINIYGVSSPIRLALVKMCLGRARYVAPAGRSVISFIRETYGVPNEKIVFLHPKVDTEIFFTPTREQREIIRVELGIPVSSSVIFSCRRFAEGWGPYIVRELFVELMNLTTDFYFIVLSGYSTNNLFDDFVASLPEVMRSRFVFIRQSVSLGEFGKYAKASDFFVSAMTNRDMQSSSIMQSTACGSYPILLEQEEYRYMVQDGLSALMFSKVSRSLADRIIQVAHDRKTFEAFRARNRKYIESVVERENYVSRLNSLEYD